MANYYTMRFQPLDWPPPSGEVPPGTDWSARDLADEGLACCATARARIVEIVPLETPWAYRMTYRLACPDHGEATVCVESRLDWISPNEYLMIRVSQKEMAR